MDTPEPLDWSLIRSFLAVAEAGSLSAAARAIGISQPTLGRHIRDAEAQFGVPLFQRIATGLRLTDAGQALLAPAQDMRNAAARVGMVAACSSGAMAGTVRITASRVMSHHVLPALIARLRMEEPAIQIELVPSDTSENLLFGEADIALRMYRPTQLDIITRQVAALPIGLYAATSFIARRGVPLTRAVLEAQDFVGFDRDDRIVRMMQDLGLSVDRRFFPVRCDDQLVYINLIRAGCGIGGVLRLIGDADPDLQAIDGIIDLPVLPVWLAAAPGPRRTPRVARVWDALAAGLARIGGA